MKAYTWCKTSYIPDSGQRTFPDGYIGALTARTAWSNKILKAMEAYNKGEIHINPRDISKLYARGKFYFNNLLKEGYKIKVEAVIDIERGKIDIF